MPLFLIGVYWAVTTKHTRRVGETYWQHLRFSLGVSFRLFTSSVLFFVHGVCPWIKIPPSRDLGRTSFYLMLKNRCRMAQRGQHDTTMFMDTD